jgi:hypothetical protein
MGVERIGHDGTPLLAAHGPQLVQQFLGGSWRRDASVSRLDRLQRLGGRACLFRGARLQLQFKRGKAPPKSRRSQVGQFFRFFGVIAEVLQQFSRVVCVEHGFNEGRRFALLSMNGTTSATASTAALNPSSLEPSLSTLPTRSPMARCRVSSSAFSRAMRSMSASVNCRLAGSPSSSCRLMRCWIASSSWRRSSASSQQPRASRSACRFGAPASESSAVRGSACRRRPHHWTDPSFVPFRFAGERPQRFAAQAARFVPGFRQGRRPRWRLVQVRCSSHPGKPQARQVATGDAC